MAPEIEITMIEAVGGIVGLALTGICTVMWSMFNERKAAHDKEIAEIKVKYDTEMEVLWKKHDEDVIELRELQREIDRKHYVKDELDKRFEKLEHTISIGLSGLGDKFDKFGIDIIGALAEYKK